MLGLAWWASSARSDSSTGPTVENEQVSELIASLEDPRSAIRREAMVRLARIGPSAGEAIPGVTSRLQDDDPFVRAHAARAACRIGVSPTVVVPVLSDLLQPDEPQLCCLASLILGEIGSTARPAVPTLRSCMKSRDGSIRLHAAEAILKIDSTDWTALRELMAGMDDDAADLRYFAANALGEAALDNEQAIFALQKALTDVDTTVAITAALNLSKRFHLPRGGAVNVPEMEELTRLIENLRDPLPATRKTAAIRLGLAGPAARRAGIALLERLADPDRAVRVHVAHALWQIERPAGAIVPVLVDLLGVTESNTRIAATYVLGEIGPAAGDALPALYDMFAGSKLRNRLLLSMAITLIEPRDREMIGILIGGLHEQTGDVRYQSAMALGSAPVAHQRRVEKALTQAADDRNLRVQAAAAEALSRFELRIHEARHALSAQYVSSFGSPAATPATSTTVTEASPESEPSPAEEVDDTRISSVTDGDALQRDSIPPIGDIAQSVEPRQSQEKFDDPDEGLRPIREVSASIRPMKGEDPPDYAASRVAGEPGRFQSLGTTRGWSPITYGWDAPAMYYNPAYFEDINLERYGIHYGLCSPVISFGKFFGGFPVLPYKLIVQPMCECHYTLGFERPNNCVPVHCFGWGCPNTTLLWWCSRHNYCPIRATCPWTRDCRPCNTDGSTYCRPDGEMAYESGDE
jgi:HEAT repeat protein